ncbi:hypothetical protein CVT24_009805 [Panaeolus cyanescens]|uniref:Uncharacterized protein n=1 Tax=Panaeolus cyanescens TaxID=181874 RepID=A0A409VE54_9AGAR|nr:hypothetical protein CVT24_009805 [Panaeolus cyanescens]
MPRGIPNAKRDDTGLRFTTFSVPLAFNPKHASSTYLKSESQSIWARNSARKGKASSEEQPTEHRRGSQVIVIHPGSRYMRIGRASDVTPTSVPCVVARRCNTPITAEERVPLVSRPRRKDEESSSVDVDPFEAKLSTITSSLRDRMKFYKLRVTPNTQKTCSTFNEQFKPERIAEHNDYQTEWIDSSCPDDVLVGEKALRIADPVASRYAVRWPIRGSNFNASNYPSQQLIYSDLETIIKVTLEEKLNIKPFQYKNYSVILVIPDFYDRAYVREFVNLLIVSMGFKQICAQQESLAATYGAGISNACVVDIGATKTSIACVDEGMVIADTRMTLNMGGEDVTEFLYVLLERIKFPYREIDLNKFYDWAMLEDLKARICTLAEASIFLELFTLRPGKLTEKYGLRAYDEVILAPMCLFEPRVIEFDSKRNRLHPNSEGVTDEIMIHPTDSVTSAMVISTSHLMPAEQEKPPAPEPLSTPQTSLPTDIPLESSPIKTQADPQPMDVDAPHSTGPATEENPIEIIDLEDETKAAPQPQPIPPVAVQPTAPAITYPGGYPIDVCFEASKLPLDVAIFNSARAAGGDEKIRKYLQAVLVIGGSALTPGMAHALESRLQAIATPLVQLMEKVQIIPPPKEVDPRVLAWKGAAVLGKMDGVSDLWVTPSDWDVFGIRALKERCYYL